MGNIRISRGQLKKPKSKDFEIPENLSQNCTKVVKEHYPNFWVAVFSLAFLLLSLGGGTYWFLNKNRQKEMPFVYFEIMAIDESGHPIAGASIMHQKKRIGTTDSFGEWRKYIRVALGSTIKLKVKKIAHKGTLHAIKNIAIPTIEPKSGAIEVGGPIKLIKEKKKKTQLTRKRRDKKEISNKTRNISKSTSLDPNLDAMKDNFYKQIWFKSPHRNKMHSQNDNSLLIPLHVIPSLQEQSFQMGLIANRNSKWQVLLQHITNPKNKSFAGLIRVTSNRYGKEKKIDFLKNYTGNKEKTAASILKSLKDFSQSTSLAEALPNWKPKTMLIYGVNERTSSIFVGGYPAKYLGSKLWSFIHKKDSKLYLSLIEKNEVTFRQLISETSNKISIPSKPLVRR